MDTPATKIAATGVMVGMVLITLLGGVALVVRSLRNAEINVELKKDS
ncbi:MAG: hypothetical protein K0S68_709 [Candidatus Saccharibacteria bacterium]|jgi:hypothetical protein|nr:hypothetical protein [Candidatus Saccharibacteria bacterium]